MDVPQSPTQTHNGGGDDVILDSGKNIDLISSKSSDTGFASDDTASPVIEENDLPTQEQSNPKVHEQISSEEKIEDSSQDLIVNEPSTDEADVSLSDGVVQQDDAVVKQEDAVVKKEDQVPATPSAEEDSSVVTESKSDEPLDILGNGQLTKKVLVSGKGIETRPNNGDTVTVRLTAFLEDGTKVEDGDQSFILNDGDVIVALDLGVALMEMGEKCELITSSRYAFGDIGREPDIPKDASLTYTLELVDITPQVDSIALTFQQRLQHGESKRLRGNFLFGRADYSGAINSYTKAVKYLDDTDLNASLDQSDRRQLEESYTKCYNNMAACQIKIDAFDAAIRSAEKVLTAEPKNIKALFRIGKSYGSKGEVETAITYLKKAILLDPESKMLHQELFTLTKKKQKEAESEKDLYRKMLGLKDESKSKEVTSDTPPSSSSMYKWVLPVAAVVASLGFAWYRTSF